MDKCKKVRNWMRCLVGLDWAAEVASLKYIYSIYVALMRSRLDYRSIAYGSAAKTVLTGSGVIQALRLCIVAAITSPVCHTIEAVLRRKHLSQLLEEFERAWR